VCDTKIWLKQNNLTIVQRIHGEIFSQIGDEKKIHEKNTKGYIAFGFFYHKKYFLINVAEIVAMDQLFYYMLYLLRTTKYKTHQESIMEYGMIT
jgi:hypothetical protein